MMPAKFEALAVYNSEVYRGIPHTPEYDAEMAELQAEYDEWLASPAMAIRHIPPPSAWRRLRRFLGIREHWDMP